MEYITKQDVIDVIESFSCDNCSVEGRDCSECAYDELQSLIWNIRCRATPDTCPGIEKLETAVVDSNAQCEKLKQEAEAFKQLILDIKKLKDSEK